jgi:hypothetical protein
MSAGELIRGTAVPAVVLGRWPGRLGLASDSRATAQKTRFMKDYRTSRGSNSGAMSGHAGARFRRRE